MNNLKHYTALLLVLLIAVGCGSKSIVGSWESADDRGAGTITFNADNTVSMQVTAPIQMTVKGEYKLEADKLTMTVKSIEGAPPEMQRFVQQDLNKPETSTITWKSDTEFQLTGSRMNGIFKKKS